MLNGHLLPPEYLHSYVQPGASSGTYQNSPHYQIESGRFGEGALSSRSYEQAFPARYGTHLAATLQQQLPLVQYNQGLYHGDPDSDSEEYEEVQTCCGAQHMDTNAEAQAEKFAGSFTRGCMARLLHWCCLLAVSLGALALGLQAWSAMQDCDVQTYSALAWGSAWGSFAAWCAGLLAVALCALVVAFLSACGIPWQRYQKGDPARLAKVFIFCGIIGALVMVALVVVLYTCNQRAWLPVVSAANLVCQDETVWHCGPEKSSEVWATVDAASDDRPDNGLAAVAKWYLTSGDVPGPIGVCDRVSYLCEQPFTFSAATSCVCNGLSALAPTTTVTTTTTYTSTTTATTTTTSTVTGTTETESLTFTTQTTRTASSVTGTTRTLTRTSATATATTATTTRISATPQRPQVTLTWTTPALSTPATTSSAPSAQATTTSAPPAQPATARRLSERAAASGAALARAAAAAPGSPGARPPPSSSPSSGLPAERLLMALAPAPWEGREGQYCDFWSVAADAGEAEVIAHPTDLPWCFVNPGMQCAGDAELQDSIKTPDDGYNSSFLRSSGPCASSVSSRSRAVEEGHAQVNGVLWPLGLTALMALLAAASCGLRLMVLPPRKPLDTPPADTPLSLKFEMAEREVEALVNESTPQDVRLRLYGLHKQAYHSFSIKWVKEPEGDRFSSKKTWEQQKYDAWKRVQNLKTEEAMKQYIQTVEQYKAQRTKQNAREKDDSRGGCFLS